MSENIKILVVEDNDFVRMQIVQFLKQESYEVVESKDGEDALEKMTRDVDIAIVDVRMEPIDGFEFIRSIRAQDMDTEVILVTGDQNPDLQPYEIIRDDLAGSRVFGSQYRCAVSNRRTRTTQPASAVFHGYDSL